MCNGSDQAFHLVVFNRDRRRVTFVMPCIHGCRDIHSSCLALAAANTAWPNSTGLCAAAPRLGRQPRSLRMPLILMLICGLPPAVSTLIGSLSKYQSESMFRGGLLPAAPVLIECSSKYQSESMFRARPASKANGTGRDAFTGPIGVGNLAFVIIQKMQCSARPSHRTKSTLRVAALSLRKKEGDHRRGGRARAARVSAPYTLLNTGVLQPSTLPDGSSKRRWAPAWQSMSVRSSLGPPGSLDATGPGRCGSEKLNLNQCLSPRAAGSISFRHPPSPRLRWNPQRLGCRIVQIDSFTLTGLQPDQP